MSGNRAAKLGAYPDRTVAHVVGGRTVAAASDSADEGVEGIGGATGTMVSATAIAAAVAGAVVMELPASEPRWKTSNNRDNESARM